MSEKFFIETNQEKWKNLELMIKNFKSFSFKKKSANEISEFLNLFQQASHNLSYARTFFPNSPTEKYLNQIVSDSHGFLYTIQKNPFKQILYFFQHVFPQKFRDEFKGILSSFLIFLFGFLISYLITIFDTNNAYYFLPKNLISNAHFHSTKLENVDYALMSAEIMTNNIKVALSCFALGIIFGIFTIHIIFFNGCMLGSLSALVFLKGDFIFYLSLILPHGILELTAIFISGAAGLLIAKSFLFPGQFSRLDSVVNQAKESSLLMFGTIFMLIIAGLIEGFFTPLNISVYVKLLFSMISLLILFFYFIPYNFLLKR